MAQIHHLNRILNATSGLLTLALALLCASGCNRHTHRKLADRDAYRLLESRQFDQRWDIPERTVEPDPRSRLADINDPDCGPVPPDDPASKCYMRHPFNAKKKVTYWDEIGESGAIDSQHWLQYLPFNEEGEVVVDKELTMSLTLMHNREFQTRVEALYSQALSLSSNRFEFMLNWFGGTDWNFNATDDGFEAERGLGDSNQLGFRRNLATGGQLAANLANSFNWGFNGSGQSNFSAGNLAFSLTQPLLRGAFQHVRTESLTQSERSLLYAVRDFARFRRQFYLDTTSEYLNLLIETQSVKIEEENISLLERSVREHEVRLQRELVSPFQVDQVRQNYQSGRLRLINSQQRLQNSLDRFKLRMGLPARIPIRIDETFLEPFQLNSPQIEKLDREVKAFKQSLYEYTPPIEAPEAFLDEAIKQLVKYTKLVEELKPSVESELEQLNKLLKENEPSESDSEDEKLNHEQQVGLAQTINGFFEELDGEIDAAKKGIDKQFGTNLRKQGQGIDEIDTSQPDEQEDLDTYGIDEDDSPVVRKWKIIQEFVTRPTGLSDQVATLFVYQTQIRLFQIQIKPLKIEQEYAVELALKNRLDLMNSRAAVVDAYRAVEIAADQLESDLNVRASADLRTDPTKNNAFRLDGDENIYGLGLSFDGPLNRLNERNAYRAAQIRYQQQRRAYMADEDAIVNSVRANIRRLRTSRFNFQIAQQQLITSARQVRQAQLALRRGSANSFSTQNLLQAFQQLRDNKNNLVSSWIAYETSRIALFVDLELLLLDERGMWINEEQDFSNDTSGRPEFEDSPLGNNPIAGGITPNDSGDGSVTPQPLTETESVPAPFGADLTNGIGAGDLLGDR